MAPAASSAPALWLTVLKRSSPAVRWGGSFRAWTLALRIARALARYISFVIVIASIILLLCHVWWIVTMYNMVYKTILYDIYFYCK